MAYGEFAWFYDEFNGAADYDALFRYIQNELLRHGIADGLVADLGCGTGDLTLMLAQSGYDMIGVDRSEEMLSVLLEKSEELGLSGRLLLLRQDILALELYGTIRAAVSTFDTYNHIGPWENFEKAIRSAAFFMEKDGVFVFDMNTPFKHKEILGENAFDIDAPDARCRWQNHYEPEADRVKIDVDIDYADAGEIYHETFYEYSYPLDAVERCLEQYGFSVERLVDGETFGPLRPDSQRWMFTAVKRYTQEEKNDAVQ